MSLTDPLRALSVSYETDMESWEYSYTRLMQRRPLPGRWRSAFSTSFIAASILFIVLPGDIVRKLSIAGSIFCFGFILYPRLYRKNLKKGIRRLCKDRHATQEPVELIVDSDGFRAVTATCDSLIAWWAVSSIDEEPGYLEFWLADGNLVTVPDRAFSTDIQKQEFVAMSRRFLMDAADASPTEVRE